jgi:hypothetical protein
MLKCKYCESERKTLNSLRQHEIRCNKNPEGIKVTSNFYRYNIDVKNGIKEKKFSNQYTKSDYLGLEKPKMSNELKTKLRSASSKRIWTDEMKKNHSESMKKAVISHPSSYSINNVSGRVKNIEYNGFILKGKWELEFAKWLDQNKIEWTNKILKPFSYIWENNNHLYFPDFYLIDYNLYVEIKGYERERDLQKWKSVENLIVLKKNDIDDIKKGSYRLALIMR